jgi:hypothetical protein
VYPRCRLFRLTPRQSLDDVFSVSHPVFLWIFNVARNWNAVSNLLPSMRKHVYRAGLKRRLGSKFENSLLNDHGTPIEDYSLIFRELFCVAAGDLAHDLHEPLEKLGVLYDEITVTGQHAVKGAKRAEGASADLDLEGLAGGKGQLLFLVRSVNGREAEHLQTSGYCFAEPSHVIPLWAASFKVGPKLLSRRIDIMRQYAAEDRMLDPGVHLAIFAIRASLGTGRHGFDVLARKDVPNQLPTMQFPFNTLEDWQVDYLNTMDSMTMAAIIKKLFDARRHSPSEREKHFAKQVFDTIEAIKDESQDSIFYDAKLIAHPIRAPCRGVSEHSPPGVATLITFRIVVPIHSRPPGRRLIYVPLNFFKMQQQVYKNAPEHDVFARKIYAEFAPILDLEDLDSKVEPTFGLDPFDNEKADKDEGEKSRNKRDTLPSQRPPSRVKNWNGGGAENSEANLVDGNSHDDEPPMANIGGGGAAASDRQRSATNPPAAKVPGKPEVGRNAQNAGAMSMPKEEAEKQTYIDEMFTITIAKRN